MADRGAILRIEELNRHFPVYQGQIRRRAIGTIRALDGVSFDLHADESIGIVGESGCGKSTLAETLMRLGEPTSGAVFYKDENIFEFDTKQLRRYRREVQMVFQDPYSSLNPRMSVRTLVEEPLRVHGVHATDADLTNMVNDTLELVGLSVDHAKHYPHQLSGGQRQRVGIARALVLNPSVLICDEAVSALDVSVQAQVLNLLAGLKQELHLAMIFISHDLSVVRQLADRVGVMYLGKLVEMGTEHEIYETPAHPYTQALLSAVPTPMPGDESSSRIILEGDVPDPLHLQDGCNFRSRCWKAQGICAQQEPLLEARPGIAQVAACHFASPSIEATAPTQGVVSGEGGG